MEEGAPDLPLPSPTPEDPHGCMLSSSPELTAALVDEPLPPLSPRPLLEPVAPSRGVVEGERGDRGGAGERW
ncbi:Os10g0162850 [Oryza sativa Japonica Group]|uniref:Os10g0162850 protein n=1 Tax=Oryza sativa subsp. japonica TaxID=39947 RepID=A0A0P0XSN0_ORYSJ|nr:Os10g0162850 [Oryza sativa Japonica Group]